MPATQRKVTFFLTAAINWQQFLSKVWGLGSASSAHFGLVRLTFQQNQEFVDLAGLSPDFQGLRCSLQHPAFDMNFGALNPGIHVCIANTKFSLHPKLKLDLPVSMTAGQITAQLIRCPGLPACQLSALQTKLPPQPLRLCCCFFFPEIFFSFLILCICGSVCMNVHEYGDQRHQMSLEAELQAVMSCLMGALRVELDLLEEQYRVLMLTCDRNVVVLKTLLFLFHQLMRLNTFPCGDLLSIFPCVHTRH